jgi:DNA modification methylase
MNKIIQGDCLSELKKLPDESVDCVITSPPYWALRDYGVEGQLGLEKTFQEYITKLCDIFDETKRILKNSGTCWVNIGDTYYSSGKTGSGEGEAGKNSLSVVRHQRRGGKTNLPEKSLCQIPSRFAIEMVNRGWILRNEIIWFKPNCMPSSVKDRFTVDFEKVFFFVKNKKYWFETQYEAHTSLDKRPPGVVRTREYNYETKEKKFKSGDKSWKTPANRGMRYGGEIPHTYNRQGRNKRCVWKITTKPFKEAHFAVYPEKLIEPMIKAGCPVGGVVLDPFIGSGTTAVVAKKLKRNWIGTELNPEYIKIAEARIKATENPLC